MWIAPPAVNHRSIAASHFKFYDYYYPSQRGDAHYTHQLTSLPISSPPNEAKVHHEGPCIPLAQLLADSMQKSCYNFQRDPFEALGILTTILARCYLQTSLRRLWLITVERTIVRQTAAVMDINHVDCDYDRQAINDLFITMQTQCND